MGSLAVDSYRENAEVYRGDAVCKKRMADLLKELGLPLGLLPLEDLEELGYNEKAGFLWLMKKITGVKTREMLLWLSVVEVYIDDPSSGKITFKTGTGLADSFPVSAFELEAEKGKQRE
ncbi:unnamed protein product [Spirodela intermedia]|uniref:Uncharacterized protein n=1 Tax=Spirodela intermedia TaxID=51605 RepID=A0ABN7EBY4_SPIIN|nr:unnamed protein product [Spirodela intermedia]